jgi:D-aminopeptidase
MLTTGLRNLITDVPGVLVGNAEDARLKSGVTVLTSDRAFVAAVHVMGGAPGTRETDLLSPEATVSAVDALVLSGGSAFGLDAASGVVAALRRQGRGFVARGQAVPIVPAAILFDLANGGAKDWDASPYPALGEAAFAAAAQDFAIGSAGAGTGTLTATLKGGLGSASAVLENGTTVGALVAVNAIGEVTHDDGRHFWAAPFEIGDEFGGHGPAPKGPPPKMRLKGMDEGAATTIAIVATDAALSKAQARRVAVAAHNGIARAIVPAHTMLDGDLVFAASTGRRQLADPVASVVEIGHAAALCLTRAIARGVHAATTAEGDILPTWAARFSGK